MRIPKKLKIGGHLFKVETVDISSKELGSTNYLKGVIKIEKRMPHTLQESTLIHEIFHCINTTLDDDKIGHSLLDSLAEQIYQVLKDNRLLK